jgi:hypothetical protein
MKIKQKPTAAMIQLLKDTGSANESVARAATANLALALELPLRKGIMSGDILDGIFQSFVLEPGAVPEYPLDLIQPGTEKEYVAYSIPNQGYIPQRHVESDMVTIPTYRVGNSIDWDIRYSRNARWDIVGRATQVYEGGYIKKDNDDGWHVILAAGTDRNIVGYDSAATAGQFTKRLVSIGKTLMERNAGGNSTSMNRGALTDLYLSPEGMENIRDWGVDQVDEITRREIYMAPDGTITRIFSVNLHSIAELGVGQEYQNFFTSNLSGSLASTDIELAVGLDLRATDSFVNPIREEVQTFDDPALHRYQKVGVYGWAEHGFGVLDNRRVILLSF